MKHHLATLVLVIAITGTAGAQATVSGVVRDSLAKAPLRSAVVQLVHVDSITGRNAITDSLGQFRFDSVAPAKYRIGFIHPMLDSLGLDPIIRELSVSGAASLRADLAIPSAAKLRGAMCSGRAQGKALITGFVRDAQDDSPIAGAAVAADWTEMTFQKGGIVWVMPRSDAITAANGWFALCNVPSDGIMGLFATRGADSSDILDVHVSEDGFLRHDLYLGHGRGGKLSGTVRSAVNGERLSGAQVAVGGAPPVRVSAQGEWTIGDLPFGTRIIEVRAVGFYPEHRAVNVTTGAAPIHIGLSSLRAVLDTVRIQAARMQDRHQSGFEERRRRGGGLYLTAQDIAKRNAFSTADLFLGIRGIRTGFASDTMLSDQMALVDPDSLKTTQRRLLMRGTTGDLCAPSVYFNGLYVDRVDADDLDAIATPKEISGIEIYTEATAPVQFQRIGKGCGSIVIWTKR